MREEIQAVVERDYFLCRYQFILIGRTKSIDLLCLFLQRRIIAQHKCGSVGTE